MALSSLIVGCATITKDDVSGVYISNKHENSIDTLILNSDGMYEHLIYRSHDESLVYKNKGAWLLNGEELELDDFYVNTDRLYKKGVDYNFEQNFMYVIKQVFVDGDRTILPIYAPLSHYYLKID